MNNLAYASQDVDKVVPKVQEILKADVPDGTFESRVEQIDAARASVGTVAADMMKVLFGGRQNTLFTVVFDLKTPRVARVDIHMDRQGIGCHAGLITFTTLLGKPIAGELTLEAPKFLGKSKFTGADAAAAAKLNADGGLLKLADKVARTKGNSGGVDLELPRTCKLAPEGQGTRLVVGTLPRMTKMGMSATTDVKELCELAAAIEAKLG